MIKDIFPCSMILQGCFCVKFKISSAVPEVLPKGMPSKTCPKCRFNSCSKLLSLAMAWELLRGFESHRNRMFCQRFGKVLVTQMMSECSYWKGRVQADYPAVQSASMILPCRRVDTDVVYADPKLSSRFAYNASQTFRRKSNADNLQTHEKYPKWRLIL